MRPSAGNEVRIRELEQRLAGSSVPAERLPLLLELARATWLSSQTRARECLELALELARALEEHTHLSTAANMFAEMLRRSGQLDQSQKYADEALAAAQRAESRRLEAGAVNLKGKLYEDRGEYDAAAECYETCRKLSEGEGFLEGVQAALNELGGLYGLRGHPLKALDCYLQCLRIDDELGDNYFIALHRYNVGWILEQLGRWEDAAENLYRAISLSEQYGFPDLKLDAMNVLGELFLKRDRPERAKHLLLAVVDEERKKPGHTRLLADALANLGLAHFRAGELAAAQRTLDEAADVCRQTGDRREHTIVLLRLAELLIARGEIGIAEDALSHAETLCRELGLHRERAEALRLWARLALEHGDTDAAADYCAQAAETLRDMPDSYEMARVKLQHGRVLLEAGRDDRAGVLLKEAARRFRDLAAVAESEEANRLLLRLSGPDDTESAVLSGLAGLADIGLEPVSLLEKFLKLLCEVLRFDSGAVMLSDAPVVVRGRPDLTAAAGMSGRRAPSADERHAWCPVRGEGLTTGGFYLERQNPEPVLFSPDLQRELGRRAAEPMRRLAALSPRYGPDAQIPGLRYRGVVGHNPEMLNNLEVVSRVASASIAVLVKGESGTGKELIARALHESGTRSSRPFVAVNCAAVPETLLEAEFFGVEKGAATGVVQRKGKFELAHEGTIFLDEIGDMSAALQARLLRVLQEKTVERLGGTKPIEIDVRVVAATNRDLNAMVREGRFRQDLYYRLNAIELELPPLSERREDIPDFIRYFIIQSNQAFRRNVLGADEETMRCLVEYDWPGNVRQLINVIERAVVLSKGPVLTRADLTPEVICASSEKPADTGGLRQEQRRLRSAAAAKTDRQMLIRCLGQADGNVTKAARLAGYSRAQFYRLLQKYSIPCPRTVRSA